jgi:ankyrin repeat protein
MELARLLLDHGADVNARTDDGRTALAMAVKNGKEELAKLLREKGGVQ